VLAKIGWPKSMALTHTDIQVPLHKHDSAAAAAAIFPDGGGRQKGFLCVRERKCVYERVRERERE